MKAIRKLFQWYEHQQTAGYTAFHDEILNLSGK
jgi:hypothetical protein